MIVQSGLSDERDSYDYLSEYMVTGAYPPLTRALTKYNTAKQSRRNLNRLRTNCGVTSVKSNQPIMSDWSHWLGDGIGDMRVMSERSWLIRGIPMP